MTLVVDASVAVKWFVREPLHEEALRLLDHPEELHSPDLLVLEATNAAWKKVSRGEIGLVQARQLAGGLIHGVPTLYPSAALAERALELALQLRHPVWDCVYLACAETLDGTLVTDDRRFLKKLKDAGLGHRVEALG